MNRREFLSEIVDYFQVILNFEIICAVIKTGLRLQQPGIGPLRMRRIILRQAVNIAAVKCTRDSRIQQGKIIQRNRLCSLNKIKLERRSGYTHISEQLVVGCLELGTDCRRVICRCPVSRIELVVAHNREKYKVKGACFAEQVHIGDIRVLSLNLGIVRTVESRIERIGIKAVNAVTPRRGRGQRRIIIARVTHRQRDAVIALKPVEQDTALLKEIALIRKLEFKLCTGTDIALCLMYRDLKPLSLMRDQIVIAVVAGCQQHLRIAVCAGRPGIRGARSSAHIGERNIARHPGEAVRVIRNGIGRILVARLQRKRGRLNGLARRCEQRLLRRAVILEHANLEPILTLRERKIIN